MAKLLKKIEGGNPLANFRLWQELADYEAAQTDEELANFFHKMLNRFEDRPLVCSFILAMISYAVSINLHQKIGSLCDSIIK